MDEIPCWGEEEAEGKRSHVSPPTLGKGFTCLQEAVEGEGPQGGRWPPAGTSSSSLTGSLARRYCDVGNA